MIEDSIIQWIETGAQQAAPWRSESAVAPPKRVIIADDQITADAAYRLGSEGTALLWRGDFQNAKQLLQALARRIDQKKHKSATSPTDAFNQQRQTQAQRARTLGMLLLKFDDDYRRGRGLLAEVKTHIEASGGAAAGEHFSGMIAIRTRRLIERVNLKERLAGVAEVAIIFALEKRGAVEAVLFG